MMKKYIYYIAFFSCLLGISTEGQAQQDNFFSLYRHHMSLINPAATGSQEGAQLSLTYRTQWVGVEGAPETQAISYSSPTNGQQIGLGFSFTNDRTFIEQQAQMFVNFSYRLPLEKDLDLYLGISAGANGFSVNAAGLAVYGSQVDDPNLINFSRFNPNIGAGAYLKGKNFFASISSPRLLNTDRFKNQEGLVTSAADRMHFYATTGMHIPIAKNWEWVPTLMVRHVKDAPGLMSINSGFSMQRKFEFGLEYHLNTAFGANLMLRPNKRIAFGYAYTRSVQNQINSLSNGSHEVVLKIRLSQAQPELLVAENDQFERDEKNIGTKNNESLK